MKIKTPHFILAGLLATATALPAATLIDGFGTLTKDADLAIDNIDGNWHAVRTDHEATMTSTTLSTTRVDTVLNSHLPEAAIGRMIDNTGDTFSGSTISFSFDYNVLQGNAAVDVFLHLRGFDVTGLADWSIGSGRNGAAWNTPGSPDFGAGGTVYNLDDGGVGANGGSDEAVDGGFLNLSDSGTISGTFDMSGYALADLSDYDYLLAAFAFDLPAVGDGVEISNFSVTSVPEPSSAALLGGLLALSAVMLRRRAA